MRKAFSLVELMIVAAIIGILAAIVVPQFQSHSTEAKEAAAKNNLNLLRAAIELYAARHTGIAPGYPGDNTSIAPLEVEFKLDVLKGGYLKTMPKNSFNNLDTLNMIPNGGAFPADATGQYGWVYQPQSKTIRLDWPGTDRKGVRYYDY
jgi:prepilin-type N-terminal cleavage/methylation domain-containing protein